MDDEIRKLSIEGVYLEIKNKEKEVSIISNKETPLSVWYKDNIINRIYIIDEGKVATYYNISCYPEEHIKKEIQGYNIFPLERKTKLLLQNGKDVYVVHLTNKNIMKYDYTPLSALLKRKILLDYINTKNIEIYNKGDKILDIIAEKNVKEEKNIINEERINISHTYSVFSGKDNKNTNIKTIANLLLCCPADINSHIKKYEVSRVTQEIWELNKITDYNNNIKLLEGIKLLDIEGIEIMNMLWASLISYPLKMYKYEGKDHVFYKIYLGRE